MTDNSDGFGEYHLMVGIWGCSKGSAEPAAEGVVECHSSSLSPGIQARQNPAPTWGPAGALGGSGSALCSCW